MPTDRILIFDPTARRARKKNRRIAAYQSDRKRVGFRYSVCTQYWYNCTQYGYTYRGALEYPL